MKKYLVLILFVIAFCCKNKEQGNELAIEINTALVRKYTQADSLIIITCNRCSCFVDALNSLSDNEKSYLNQYLVLTDTNCNHLNIPSMYINSRSIDSISEDIYNISLFKKKANRFEVRIIQLKESKRIISVIKDFFEP